MLRVKKIKPMFTAIITTMDIYEEDGRTTSGIIDATKQRGTVKEYQKVVAVGDSVRGIKVGDMVSINPTRFAVRKNHENSIKNDIEGGNPVLEYRFDQVLIDGKAHLLIQDRDVEFIIEDYEEIPDNATNLVTPPKDIIV